MHHGISRYPYIGPYINRCLGFVIKQLELNQNVSVNVFEVKSWTDMNEISSFSHRATAKPEAVMKNDIITETMRSKDGTVTTTRKKTRDTKTLSKSKCPQRKDFQCRSQRNTISQSTHSGEGLAGGLQRQA